MEEILQEIDEFPTSGFFVEPILILIISFFIYDFRPRYFPCKFWKPLAIIYIFVYMYFLHYIEMDIILWQEDIPNLVQSDGILMYKEHQKGQNSGFYLIDEKGNRISWLNFMLCSNGIDIHNHLNKNITVWRRSRVVYQLQVGDSIIYDIGRSNQKVWLGNLFHFMNQLFLFFAVLFGYFLMLYTLNGDYKKKE